MNEIKIFLRPYNFGMFLSSCTTSSFSRRAQLHASIGIRTHDRSVRASDYTLSLNRAANVIGSGARSPAGNTNAAMSVKDSCAVTYTRSGGTWT
jgi:hypothetical protein